MSNTNALVRYDGCRVQVDKLVEARADMGVVERAIESYALDSDEKAALWLWANGRRDQRVSAGAGRPLLGHTDPY
ncbi:MAG: hypothetical protein ACRDLS_09410 [Solirubrobacteraceae bacterium]